METVYQLAEPGSVDLPGLVCLQKQAIGHSDGGAAAMG